MSERVPTLWTKKPRVAVASPYPSVEEKPGGVPHIRYDENVFFNELPDVRSVEVMPRISWDAPRWDKLKSMSAGYAFNADPAKYGTDAWWSKPDPRDILKLMYLSDLDFIDWHEPAMDWNAYMVGLMRAWHPRNHELVMFANLHADTSEENLLRFRWGSRFAKLFNFMDVAITNNYYNKQKAEKVLGDGGRFAWTYEVIPNPVDTKLFTPDGRKLEMWRDHYLSDDIVKILYVGRLEDRKGLFDAVVAFSRLLEDPDGPKNFRFIIAGSGPDEGKLHELVAAFHLEDHVIFLGKISEEDKYKAYRSADFCYFPSWRGESFGDVLLEAMASEVPVLAGMGYEHSPAMKHGENGFLLRSRRPDEGAVHYLNMLIKSKALREYLASNARSHVEQFAREIVYGMRIDLANETHRRKMKDFSTQKVVFNPYPLAVATSLVASSYTAGKVIGSRRVEKVKKIIKSVSEILQAA